MARDHRDPIETVRWTYEDLRQRLMAGEAARDRGGADGQRNLPAAGSATPSAYQRDVLHRAQELAHLSEETAQEDLRALIADMRDNPYVLPGSGPEDRCPAAVAAAVAEADHLVQAQGADLREHREREEVAGRNCRRDFQAARGSTPRGGWKSIRSFWEILVAVGLVEGGAAYFILEHALGWSLAVLQGFTMAGVIIGLGYAAGHLSLRPASHADARAPMTLLRRGGAVVLALLAAGLLYVMAAVRACLIEGLDGTAAEVLSRASQPLSVLVHWETLGLMVIGLVGFGAGAWKAHDFWHGLVPPLRASGRAHERAAAALRDRRDDLVAAVNLAAEGAIEHLSRMLAAARDWARAMEDRADAATARILEANRRREILQRAVEGVDTDYREGNQEVRSEPSPAWPALPAVGIDLIPPKSFAEARAAMREIAASWAASVKASQADIHEARQQAIAHIDLLAGFAPLPGPSRVQALSYARRD
jgi:hypothetical protein